MEYMASKSSSSRKKEYVPLSSSRVSVTEGGVYVKETDKKASNIGGRGHEEMVVPVLNRFTNTKAPEYKRIMVDKYSASPVVYFKTGHYEFARAYLLKGRKGIQVTDSQFW